MNSNGKSVFGTKKLTLSSSLTTFRSHRHFSAQQQPSAAMRRHVRYPPPLMSSSGRRHRLCSRLRRRQDQFPTHNSTPFHQKSTPNNYQSHFCSKKEEGKKYDNGSEHDEDIGRIHGGAHKGHRATSSTT
ncbi:hypothetical protein ACSQ67_018190 [Phaseolus vulgaris]